LCELACSSSSSSACDDGLGYGYCNLPFPIGCTPNQNAESAAYCEELGYNLIKCGPCPITWGCEIDQGPWHCAQIGGGYTTKEECEAAQPFCVP
jgi:hypothetical protein